MPRGSGWGFIPIERFRRILFRHRCGFRGRGGALDLGLAFRRFVIQPKSLGPLSYESGIIALLIFLLMTTYLATFLPGEQESKPLWWAHVLTILAFLPLVPHTKHLHLVLSPLTVFLERDSFSKIPPLAGDDDFGLDTGKDITQLVSLQAFSCVECGRCSQHCPAANTGKVLDPKKIALGVRGYLNEFGPASEEPLIGTHISQEAIFQCTTCGACEFQCPGGDSAFADHHRLAPRGRKHRKMGRRLRHQAVPESGAQWERDGILPGERDKFIQKQALPIFDGTQEYCLWLGCMGAYDPQGREIIGSLAKIMRELNVSFGVLRKERCTGDPARRLGNDLTFGQLAEGNLESLAQSKVKKIVSICPHCVRTIGTDWREYGDAPAIEHHSEFLARHLDRLPSETAGGQKIAYHDPCYLGRYRNVYDEPRSVIGRFGTVVDPPRSRERLLLRRRRRARVPGGREGQTRQRGARRRIGSYRRGRDRSGVSILQHDVPRRAG